MASQRRNHHQARQEARARSPPRRRVEGRLRRLRDGDDGVLPAAVAAQRHHRRAEARHLRLLLPGERLALAVRCRRPPRRARDLGTGRAGVGYLDTVGGLAAHALAGRERGGRARRGSWRRNRAEKNAGAGSGRGRGQARRAALRRRGERAQGGSPEGARVKGARGEPADRPHAGRAAHPDHRSGRQADVRARQPATPRAHEGAARQDLAGDPEDGEPHLGHRTHRCAALPGRPARLLELGAVERSRACVPPHSGRFGSRPGACRHGGRTLRRGAAGGGRPELGAQSSYRHRHPAPAPDREPTHRPVPIRAPAPTPLAAPTTAPKAQFRQDWTGPRVR